jgi:hypothetical protein
MDSIIEESIKDISYPVSGNKTAQTSTIIMGKLKVSEQQNADITSLLNMQPSSALALLWYIFYKIIAGEIKRSALKRKCFDRTSNYYTHSRI